MPIDVDKVVGAQLPGDVTEWDEDKVILYHLGVGAGVPATDPGELQYTYESSPLKVLPSFGVVPVFRMLGGLVGLDGLTFNPMMLLHGEQDLALHKPLPARAKVENTGRVAKVYDKGKGALVVVETETKDESGELLCTNRFGVHPRRGGLRGRERAPAGERRARAGARPRRRVAHPAPAGPAVPLGRRQEPPPRRPEHGGPRGFDKPILHGLCSYGIVCKAAVDAALDGDVTKVARYQARFSGVVFPGETIVTSMWREGDKVVLSAATKERGTPVITNAALTVKES